MDNLQGVCKDCGNGTLNNELHPAFVFGGVDSNENEYLICNRCGSTHVDIIPQYNEDITEAL